MLKLIVPWLPPSAWAAFIFALSNTPDLGTGLGFDFLLRKAAHMAEYLILTMLVHRAMRLTSGLEFTQRLAWAAALAFLYAVSDEIHQLFIPGRQGTPADVAVDSLGIALAAAWLWRRQKERAPAGTSPLSEDGSQGHRRG